MGFLSLGLRNLSLPLETGPLLSGAVPGGSFFILLEDGSDLLQEDGSKFLLELAP